MPWDRQAWIAQWREQLASRGHFFDRHSASCANQPTASKWLSISRLKSGQTGLSHLSTPVNDWCGLGPQVVVETKKSWVLLFDESSEGATLLESSHLPQKGTVRNPQLELIFYGSLGNPDLSMYFNSVQAREKAAAAKIKDRTQGQGDWPNTWRCLSIEVAPERMVSLPTQNVWKLGDPKLCLCCKLRSDSDHLKNEL